MAGSVVCPSCGAGVSAREAACPYCRTGVVLPPPKGADEPAQRRTYCARCGNLYDAEAARCPRCPVVDESVMRGGKCPRCGDDLEPQTMSGVAVDRCRGCKGLWFDGDEVEHTIDTTTRGVSTSEAMAIRPALPNWLKVEEDYRHIACVRCGQLMSRRQVVPRSGVIIDACRDHGVWFDPNEFEQFAEFVRAGGLEIARHDEIWAAEMRRRHATAMRPEPTPGEKLGLLKKRDPNPEPQPERPRGLIENIVRAIFGL